MNIEPWRDDESWPRYERRFLYRVHKCGIWRLKKSIRYLKTSVETTTEAFKNLASNSASMISFPIKAKFEFETKIIKFGLWYKLGRWFGKTFPATIALWNRR